VTEGDGSRPSDQLIQLAIAVNPLLSNWTGRLVAQLNQGGSVARINKQLCLATVGLSHGGKALGCSQATRTEESAVAPTIRAQSAPHVGTKTFVNSKSPKAMIPCHGG